MARALLTHPGVTRSPTLLVLLALGGCVSGPWYVKTGAPDLWRGPDGVVPVCIDPSPGAHRVEPCAARGVSARNPVFALAYAHRDVIIDELSGWEFLDEARINDQPVSASRVIKVEMGSVVDAYRAHLFSLADVFPQLRDPAGGVKPATYRLRVTARPHASERLEATFELEAR